MKKMIQIFMLVFLISCGKETTKPVHNDTPTNLQLYLITSTSIRLRWENHSNRETGYLIERRSEGETDFVSVVTLPADTDMYLDENLEQETQYFYRVAAVLENDQSDWSNVASLATEFTLGDMEFGEEDTFEVMTWNIEKFPVNGSVTTTYVKQALLGLQVDVAALQEIKEENTFYTMIDELQMKDPDSGWTGAWLHCDNFGNNLAYAYRGNHFTSVNIYSIYNTDWYAFPRPPFVMEGHFQEKDFVIINNHFKAMGDADSIERRRQASLKLDNYIRQHFDGMKVIVLGDLNDTLIKPEDENVFWNYISAPDYYLFADWDIAHSGTWGWSYPSWPSHIDHILITHPLFPYFHQSDTVVETIRIDTYLTNLNYYYTNISDHRPVAMKISLNETEK